MNQILGTKTEVDFDVRDYLHGVAAVYGGLANVCMQLSLLPVGRGVVESKVDSGNILKHPVKRGRTTFSYVAVALMGTEAERFAYREAVNGQHRQVRSGPDSLVKYNAFDADLQLWVAACIYDLVRETHIAMRGPLGADEDEQLLQHCGRLATTLQVKPEQWPASRADFVRYWSENIAKVGVDDKVRRYLRATLSVAKAAPGPFTKAGEFVRRVNVGFLPAEVRAALDVPWTQTDQDWFDKVIARTARVERSLPRSLRAFPFNVMLWDVRRRLRTARPLV